MSSFLPSSLSALARVTSVGLAVACGEGLRPDPFQAGVDAGAGGEGGRVAAPTGLAGSVSGDPGLGGPCQSDAQCDDGLGCSEDSCDPLLARCRFLPDDARCADALYCNGTERCELRLGCVPGDEVTCDDRTTCTIDRCVEETQSCEHTPRDADLDGDPDGNCSGGADCDDTDATVSSSAREICANGRDDDCDAEQDEADCALPEHDSCADALEISAEGTFALDLSAARGDYAASCVAAAGSLADAVVAITVSEEPADVELVARRSGGTLALAAAGLCGDASSELGCAAGVTTPRDDVAARLLLRALEPGTTPVVVFASGPAAVELTVRYLPPSAAPENETCGTAMPLLLGEEVVAELAGTSADLSSQCASGQGDLVYSVTLEQPQDLRVQATSLDGLGRPVLSLMGGSCTSEEDELGCISAEPATLFRRALPAGTHYLGVSADGPGDVAVYGELGPPSEPPEDESCERASTLPHNQALELSFVDHMDDLRSGCLDGAGEAVLALELERASDVLLLASFSDGDQARIALVEEACVAGTTPTECSDGLRSPVRLGLPGIPAGRHRIAFETRDGNPVAVTALVRPARSTMLVPFADGCDDVLDIPVGGARLEGNTANANADYLASCDEATPTPGGAPDQLLRLLLERPQRVVIDAGESGYQTIIDVRRGPDCPGSELPQACAAGYVAGRSFLDLLLDAGSYWVQVDGFAGASGPWSLDVFIAEPPP